MVFIYLIAIGKVKKIYHIFSVYGHYHLVNIFDSDFKDLKTFTGAFVNTSKL